MMVWVRRDVVSMKQPKTDTSYYTILSDDILHLLGVTTMKKAKDMVKTQCAVPSQPVKAQPLRDSNVA